MNRLNSNNNFPGPQIKPNVDDMSTKRGAIKHIHNKELSSSFLAIECLGE